MYPSPTRIDEKWTRRAVNLRSPPKPIRSNGFSLSLSDAPHLSPSRLSPSYQKQPLSPRPAGARNGLGHELLHGRLARDQDVARECFSFPLFFSSLDDDDDDDRARKTRKKNRPPLSLFFFLSHRLSLSRQNAKKNNQLQSLVVMMSVGFIAFVTVLHIIGKVRRERFFSWRGGARE